MSKNRFLGLLTLFNIGFISFLLLRYGKQIQPELIIVNFYQVPIGLILGMLILSLLVLIFYGKRLDQLLDENNRIGFGIASVGYAANNLMPFRLGEACRIYFSRKKYGIAIPHSLALLFIERVSDLFFIGCLACAAILASTNQLPLNTKLLLLGFLGPLIIWGFYLLRKQKMALFYSQIQQYPLYKKYIEPLLSHIQDKLKIKKMLGFGLYTLLIWLLTVFSFFIFFKTTLQVHHFSVTDAICLTVCTSLSLAISTLPSNIGLFEASIVFYLYTIKQVDKHTAIALALMLHTLILLPQLVCMAYFLVFKRRAFNLI